MICLHFIWIINGQIFGSFRTATMVIFHSIDYSSIAPNGSDNKDMSNVKCGLQLLQLLPPFISRIKVGFDLKCNDKKQN